MGKILIIIGFILIVIGIIVSYRDRIPFLGKLPGDIAIEKGNFRFYFPIATSIVLSLIFSLLLYFINPWRQ